MIGRNIFSKYPELSFPWEAKQHNTPIISYNNNKMRTTTLDCHSTGTVPTLKAHIGNPSSCFSTILVTVCKCNRWDLPQVFRLSFLHMERFAWVLEFLNMPFPPRDSSSPPQLNMAWAKPSFALLSTEIAWQTFFDACQKSSSIASLNSSHTQVFAWSSVQLLKPPHLAPQYLLREYPWANPV